MKLPTDISLDRLGPQLLQAWQWWASELIELVPTRLRQLFERQDTTISIDYASPDVAVRRQVGDVNTVAVRFNEADLLSDPQTPIEMPARLASDEPVTVRVPAALALTKRIELPWAAASDLRQIVNTEALRLSPIPEDQVAFDWSLVERASRGGRVKIDVYLVERLVVERTAEIARRLGLIAGTVALEGDANPDWRIALKPTLPMGLLWRRYSPPALACLTLALGVTTIGAAYVHDIKVKHDLEHQVQQAKGEADTVTQLKATIETANQDLAFLDHEKGAPLVTGVLAELTHILPDSASLFYLSLSPSKVSARGYAEDASNLIHLIDASPSFESAAFEGQLMQGPSGNAQRFDISFKLKAGTK